MQVAFRSGSLRIIIGSMFSGKTIELLRELTVFAEMGLKVLYVNFAQDDREDGFFSTHSAIVVRSTQICMIKADRISEITDIDNYDVIGIDESQFFPDLLETVNDLVENRDKKVIIAGLDGTFERRRFGQILDLIPLCDSITKLTAFCDTCCKNGIYSPALFTKRTSEDKDEVVIGGKDKYIPVCRSCFKNQ